MAGDRQEKDKATKASVGFVVLSSDKGEECRKCEHFIFGHPPHCEVVKGQITWHGWCEKFYKRSK